MDKICHDVLRARCVVCPYTVAHLIHGADHSLSDQKARPKANKTRIEITTDANGEPELPSIEGRDKDHAKVIQGMIRDYCIAHIREFNPHFMQFHITHMTQGLSPEIKVLRSPGQRYRRVHLLGLWRRAIH